MSVKCGNKIHGTGAFYHETAADVKACFLGDRAFTVFTKPAGIHNEHDEHGIIRKPSHPSLNTDQVNVLDRLRRQVTGETSDCTGMAPDPLRGGMTQKQYEFAQRLLAERQTHLTAESFDGVTRSLASTYIGQLIAAPKTTAKIVQDRTDYANIYSDGMAPASDLATEDGIYRNQDTGEIFKCQFNRAQGDGSRLYAKQLLLVAGDWPDAGMDFEVKDIPLTGAAPDGKLDWRYVGSIAKAGVKAAWRMTREDAAAFGALYGICVRCHRDLTREESIERAMGPICANKMGW